MLLSFVKQVPQNPRAKSIDLAMPTYSGGEAYSLTKRDKWELSGLATIPEPKLVSGKISRLVLKNNRPTLLYAINRYAGKPNTCRKCRAATHSF